MPKLRSLICHHIGPFDESKMIFEEQLTVVTGRNDAGKSRLLRVIQMMLARNADELASELEINLDHLSGASKPWKDDDRVACDAEFTISDTTRNVNAHVKLVPSQMADTQVRHPNRGTLGGTNAINLLPKCLLFGPNEDDGVRQDLALDKLNPTEKRFFGLAFGPNANVQSLAAMSPVAFETTISRAESTLNKRLDQLLPQTLRFRFRLRSVADKRDRLIVNLEDQHSCSTALGMRGSGVRKMINLLSRLAIENIGEEPTIVMLDEPETSLHADAQHTLRGFLEELAKLPTIQVIYATHSPCMVNCMRPETLRLMERVAHGEGARSRMVSVPIGGGFAAIRSSLGTSPADSLLYAPLTMVVEGSTEELCLPLVLQKLGQSGIAAFEGVNQLLA